MKSNRMSCWMLLIFLLFFLPQCATQQAAVQTPPPEAAVSAGKGTVIERISFQEEDRFTRIHVEGSQPMELPFYKLLTDPLRIAIDIPNADLRQFKEPLKIENGTVRDVMATQYDGKGRIEIGLLQMTNYNISKGDRTLTIDIEKGKRVAEAKPEQPAVRVTEVTPPEVRKEEPSPAPAPAAAPPAPLEPVVKAKAVTEVSVEEKPDVVTFVIHADGKVENYNAFTLDSPPRLVVDLWGVESRLPKSSMRTKNPFVQGVRVGRYPDKLRIVFDGAKSPLPAYAIQAEGDRLSVSFGNVAAAAKTGLPAPSGTTARIPSGKAAVVTRFDFKQMDHQSRIAVGTTEETLFDARMVSKEMLVVDLKNASVPKHLRRALDTREFDSPVENVTIQNVKSGKVTDVKVSIKLREEVPYQVNREGKDLFIDLERPKRTEVKKEEPSIEPKKETVAPETKPGAVPSPVEKPALPAEPSRAAAIEVKGTEEEGRAKVYTGRRMSLDFKDADIKNIIRLIAEVSELNIIAGDDVTGKVTMRLVDVPWDQALDVVLQSRNLGMTRAGNVIRVAPMETLKKEEQGVLEAKRAKEKLEDLVTELVPVNYSTGKEIIPQVKSVLSDRGDVKVDERTNTLIIKDIARNVNGARTLIKTLDTKTPQVLIEARIVEATMTFQRELGVSWGFQVVSGKDTGNQGTVQGGITNNKLVDLPAIARTGAGTAVGTSGILEFLFTSVHGLRELDIAISAHENQGDLRVISSPKIATLDNKEASVEQGLRIPYLKLTSEGTVTTDFIDANLKLTVTPHVTNDGNIKMRIVVRKDAPDQSIQVQGVPSIDKKEAITEVLVRDSGVVVIAGIYTIEKTDGVEGIPGFKNIPLLGWLFKREAKEDKRRDLMIFISPKLIKDQV